MTNEVMNTRVGDRVSFYALKPRTSGTSGDGIVSKLGRVNISIDIVSSIYGPLTLTFRREHIKGFIIHKQSLARF